MPFNFFVVWLLRSPLHGLVSGSTMLVQYTGRKSGKTYAVPVNYLRVDGALITISMRERTWWRNLRPAPAASHLATVTLRLKGQEVSAQAEVYEQPEDVAQALLAAVASNPRYAGFLKIGKDEAGQPLLQDARTAAAKHVVVRFRIP